MAQRVGSRRSGPGRPEILYGLTDAADAWFPNREIDVLRELTTYLQNAGERNVVNDFFADYVGRRRPVALSRVEDLSGEARLEEVARILTEYGFMAEVQLDGEGKRVLRLSPCPLSQLVDVTRAPCRAELSYVRDLLGEGLARVSYTRRETPRVATPSGRLGSMTEAWLRGPVEGVPDALMPAAHGLLDALEDMEAAASTLTVEQLWMRPGGAASVGFHLRHVDGSVERLLTYARGASLTPRQLAAISWEGDPGERPRTAAELPAALRVRVIDALNDLRSVAPDTLLEARRVGRAGLPSTVQGLLFHSVEHARRHAGQVIATAGIITGLGLSSDHEAPRTVGACAVALKDDREAGNGAEDDAIEDLGEALRNALVEAAVEAHHDAGVRGLCAEGLWDVAVDAMRSLDLRRVLGRARPGQGGP